MPAVDQGAQVYRKHAASRGIDEAEGLRLEVRLDPEVLEADPALLRQIEIEALNVQDLPRLRQMSVHQISPGVHDLEEIRFFLAEVHSRARDEVIEQPSL